MKRKILKLGRVREMRNGFFGRVGEMMSGGFVGGGLFGRMGGGGLRLENRTGSGVMWGLKDEVFHRNLGSFPGFGKKLMAGGGGTPL